MLWCRIEMQDRARGRTDRPTPAAEPGPQVKRCVRIMRGESPVDLVAEGVMTGEGSPEAGMNCQRIFRAPPAPERW